MTFTLIILAFLSIGARVETIVTEIPTLEQCRTVAAYITGEIERRGGTVKEASCK